MKPWQKILIGILICILLAVLIGPFLIPVPPLTDTVSEKELADLDSKFIQVNGLTVHYKEMGQGQPVFILLHGFGASLFSWRSVLEPLARLGRVIAYDRPAFGLTSRPMPGEWSGASPYSSAAQAQLVLGLMDALGVEKAWLVGNSAGGTVAVAVALEHPERVAGLILVDAAIYAGGGSPAWVRPLFNTPQFDHLGPLLARQLEAQGDDFIRTAYHDPALVTAEVLAGYHKPLRANHWDRALWELTKASQPLNLAARLKELTLPVLVITGDDDRIVPTAQSLQLAQDIPGAQLAVIQNAGHLPHEEKPLEFMRVVQDFTNGLK
jgi:pimeloyl-ACP methyl ester carboxylesterase